MTGSFPQGCMKPLRNTGINSWLLLGNILHVCLLWFSGMSPLNLKFAFLLPFQRQPRTALVKEFGRPLGVGAQEVVAVAANCWCKHLRCPFCFKGHFWKGFALKTKQPTHRCHFFQLETSSIGGNRKVLAPQFPGR